MFKKHKSEDSHAILDEQSRIRKAKKISAALNANGANKKKKLLDIGTGSGHIAHALSKDYKEVSSVDIVDERSKKSGYSFEKVDDETLPFKDGEFDIVVTNHVIEHTPKQQLHLSEIARATKKGGLVYLATPNRYWLYDPHYRLPFISALPASASRTYLKLTQGKEWDIFPLSARSIHKMGKKAGFSETKNITPEIIKHPSKYNLDTYWLIKPFVKLFPIQILRILEPILPTHIFILKK